MARDAGCHQLGRGPEGLLPGVPLAWKSETYVGKASPSLKKSLAAEWRACSLGSGDMSAVAIFSALVASQLPKNIAIREY